MMRASFWGLVAAVLTWRGMLGALLVALAIGLVVAVLVALNTPASTVAF